MLVYYGPDGEFMNNPSNEFLKSVINKESDYWQHGGGDSSLFFEGDNERLIFFKVKKYGFFIMRHPDYTAPFNDSKKIETVYHNVGGEPMPTPSCSYVNKETAINIILEFAKKGNIEDLVIWKDIYSIIEYDS